MKGIWWPEEIVRRFCEFLGRRNFASVYLDWIAGWITQSAPQLVYGPNTVLMSKPPGSRWSKGDAQPGGVGPPAPSTPASPHGYTGPHANNCDHLRYRGMHGTPCKYEAGSLTKCPSGTVVGWFWKYKVPHFGTIYYADCCGKAPRQDVFCNWTKEQNWCLGKGGNLYTCTVALRADQKGVLWDLKQDAAGNWIWSGVT